MSRFIVQFAAFFLALAAMLAGVQAMWGSLLVHPLAFYTLAYMALLTLVTYWMTARLISASPDNFMLAYFGSMVMRLLLSLGLVLVHFYRGGATEGQGTWTFLGAFFILYFLAAGFEIWAILTNLRPFSKKQVPEK
ncbi:hypothetical protein GCM10023185_11430 [Hymenobacter saemangeumensis]|uniref:Uncharacterized protein n=1 Tax=Hymenobacter saemangeumensis TaxID=1084522 RepID=A0ABP8I695_9BACT